MLPMRRHALPVCSVSPLSFLLTDTTEHMKKLLSERCKLLPSGAPIVKPICTYTCKVQGFMININILCYTAHRERVPRCCLPASYSLNWCRLLDLCTAQLLPSVVWCIVTHRGSVSDRRYVDVAATHRSQFSRVGLEERRREIRRNFHCVLWQLYAAIFTDRARIGETRVVAY